MTTLHELSNTDKHRTIQPVWLRPDVYQNVVLETHDCIVRRIRDMRPPALDVDIEVTRVYAKKTGRNPDIALQGYVATSIALDNGMWLGNFLKAIKQFTPWVMAQFSEPDPDLTKLLASGALLQQSTP